MDLSFQITVKSLDWLTLKRKKARGMGRLRGDSVADFGGDLRPLLCWEAQQFKPSDVKARLSAQGRSD